MSEALQTVALVMSEDAGNLLPGLASRVPVWVVGTPSNTALAQSIWSQTSGPSQLQRSVTTFVPGKPFEPLAKAASLVGTIEEHHPGLQNIEVFGLELSSSAEAVFRSAGFGKFSTIVGGFRISRVDP
jgi:hypothetical protein